MHSIFLDVTNLRLLVERVGIEQILLDVTRAVEADYWRWEEFTKVARTAHHAHDVGVLELMPVGDAKDYAFKYVNGHPYNPRDHKLPTVMAFGALMSVESGYPVMVSEMTILTGIRTAAVSLLAAQKMARKDSKRLALIGNGAQAEFQILAFYFGMGIKEFTLFDIDPLATKKVCLNLASFPDIRLEACDNTEQAVHGADIITTCTADKNLATIVTNRMIEPGMHINAIGGDCPGKTELENTILDRSRIVVEFEPQSRVEGEIQHRPDIAVIELFSVIRGEAIGRETEEEVTLFDSVGFALQDLSVLKVVYELAKMHGIGTQVELIPDSNDVKDLFGLIKPIHATKK